MGTRISLYYIFVVFLTLFVIRPLLAVALLDAEERQAFLTGDTTQIDLGFSLAIEAILAPFVILVTIGFVHFVDRKPLYAIGALWPPGSGHRAGRELFAAGAGAAALLGLWYAVAGFFVDFEISGAFEAPEGTVAESATEILLLGLGFLAAACLQEWILRGYIYSTLREKLSWVHAGGIAALLFVMLHLLVPDIPAPGLVTLFLLGFVLAAVRELTGSLWPGTLLHASWNFVMGCVLSLPVSGNSVPSRHAVEVKGPEAWSGGDYGPEGSWLTVGLLLAAVVGFAAVLSRDGENEDSDSEASDD